jgi:hypothetical protein
VDSRADLDTLSSILYLTLFFSSSEILFLLSYKLLEVDELVRRTLWRKLTGADISWYVAFFANARTGTSALNDIVREQVGGVMFQMVVMVAYTIVLLMFIYRWRSQKPFAHQIELLNWWPNALRVKSMKKGQASSVSSESSGGVLKHADSDVSKGIGRAESGDALNEKIIKRRSGFGNAGALGGVDATEKEVKGAKILLGACLSSTLFIFIR